MKAVQRYLNGTEGYRSLALQLGVEPQKFHNWIKKFEYHGEKAFKEGYTTAFKLDVLNYMNNQGNLIEKRQRFLIYQHLLYCFLGRREWI
ncbi:transposase [Rummeliibacillus sp. SL167]|uniref:transposase n=1 Tax=Rummeliibacillus sp. SL167 TaxID=2579792 RepID=UPI0011B39DE5